MIRKILPAAIALLLFAWLAAMVTAGRTQAFDDSIRAAVHAHASPALDIAMQNISRIGEPKVLIDTGAVLLLFFLATRKWRTAWLVLLTVGGAELIDQILKLIFHRPRPHVFFGRQPFGYSFPSGHSLVSFVVFGALAVFLTPHVRSRVWRWVLYLAAASVVLAIGLSRVYLGMHYPTDVLGGYVAGVFWLTVVDLLWDRWRRDRTLRSRSH